ncbi:hypothetical protein [Nocardia sp. BMG111209]|uniref:hypothetical protein n=1 Tax=Nocardia sp. BMG111209 TaxID=1160137 RepID=UPI00037A556B|nr:hypothetical protein [Nocardia sp. BMG111209]
MTPPGAQSHPQDPVSQFATFSKVDVPGRLISENAVREQSWCILRAADGWYEVFYYEHGSRTEKLGRAATRTAALRLLGGRLLHADILNRRSRT